MESKDHIRNTNPEELLKTHNEQLEKDGEANDQELDFSTIDTSDTSDAIDTKDSIDATDLTDPREFDASILAEDDEANERLDAGDIGKADWGDVDPQDTPGGSRSGMDPSGPGSAV
jgi:hypothetical protein